MNYNWPTEQWMRPGDYAVVTKGCDAGEVVRVTSAPRMMSVEFLDGTTAQGAMCGFWPVSPTFKAAPMEEPGKAAHLMTCSSLAPLANPYPSDPLPE